MSELQELFESENVEDAEALLSWASQRCSTLLDELGDDAELSALLVEGGVAGEPVAVAPTQLPGAGASGADEVTQPRARVKADPAPLPPIPSKARAAEEASDAASDDDEEIEELDIEELDVEELELIEDEDEDEDNSDDGEQQSSGVAPEPPASEPAAPAASFGPPDGTDEVPEWKAALMSAQTDDEQAAAAVKEASSADPLPEAPLEPDSGRGLAGRLEAEDDEISQHSMDFSDLDTDDE